MKHSPDHRTTAAWWGQRHGSRREDDDHLRGTFDEPAAVHDAPDGAAEASSDDERILDPDELQAEYEEPAN